MISASIDTNKLFGSGWGNVKLLRSNLRSTYQNYWIRIMNNRQNDPLLLPIKKHSLKLP